jgi:hypothetical protein
MVRSRVIIELANMASQGRYSVTPQEAARMNILFKEVAQVINELEAEEKEDAGNESSQDQ